MFYCDKEFVGKTIQELRKKAGIKQNELAEKIGISEKHLSKIETGKNYPALDNFLKMAAILNFNLENFGIEN
ncbi:MAG: helix-turn-helix transcriptional regulator [bacterium]|nr:helix-turn-helix transcriptional regulator [bacterium]